jgi:allantoate deiminase
MPAAQPHDVVRWCRTLAGCSEEPGVTTRTFLSGPMRDVHAQLTAWMERIGMDVHLDAAGNLRGVYAASSSPSSSATKAARRLFLGSHLDTVPSAGAFDGVLGVVLATALVDRLEGRRFPFTIEVVGFSDEEGTRFGAPFIGSRALAGTVDDELLERRDAAGLRVSDAIRDYGLDPAGLADARAGGDAVGYLEFHIEQGPVLERLKLPLGIVGAIAGQSRWDVVFAGTAGHAGTTPMAGRRDALACAAEWICEVERDARGTPGLVATVGRLEAQPGAGNVIAGRCLATLDVRHADDHVRIAAEARLLGRAKEIASGRGLEAACERRLNQPAVPMDPAMVATLARAVERAGHPVHHMPCGAGHDAMIVAGRMPAAMLLLRSPGGISHHPDESVNEEDVAAALAAGLEYLEELARG